MSFVNPFESSESSLSYNGISFSFAYFQHLPNVQSIDNAELKLLAKAMLKKDPKTKLKSLNSLISYFEGQSFNLATDYSFLPFYIQLYPKLAINNDKLIRLNSHRLTASIINRFGKKASVYLKNLAPIWLLGLFDTDKIVIVETDNAILSCFNKNTEKKNNLFIFFQTEILEVLDHFIKYETLDTLVDKSSTPTDEAVLIYTRSLTSFVNLLNHFTTKDLVTPKNEALFSSILKNNDQLWSHLSSNTSDYNYAGTKKALLTLANTCLMSKGDIKKYNVSISTIFKHIFKLIKAAPSHKNYYFSLIGLILITLVNLNLESMKSDILLKFKKVFVPFLHAFSANAPRDYFAYLTILYDKLPLNVFDPSSLQDFNDFVAKPVLKFKSHTPQTINQVFNFYTKYFLKSYKLSESSLKLREALVKSLQNQISEDTIRVEYLGILNEISEQDLSTMLDFMTEKVTNPEVNRYVKLLDCLKSYEVTRVHAKKLVDKLHAPSESAEGSESERSQSPDAADKGRLNLVCSIIENNSYEFDLDIYVTGNFMDGNMEKHLDLENFDLISKILLLLDKNYNNSKLKDQDYFDGKELMAAKIELIIDWAQREDQEDKSAKLLKVQNFLIKFENNIGATTPLKLQEFIVKEFVSIEITSRNLPQTLKVCFKYCDIKTLTLLYSRLLTQVDENCVFSFWDTFLGSNESIDKFNEEYLSTYPNENFTDFLWDHLQSTESLEKLPTASDKKATTISNVLVRIESLLPSSQSLKNTFFNGLVSSVTRSYILNQNYEKFIKYFLLRLAINPGLRVSIIPSPQDFVHNIGKLLYSKTAVSLSSSENPLNDYLYLVSQKVKPVNAAINFRNTCEFVVYSKFLVDLLSRSEYKAGLTEKEFIELLLYGNTVFTIATDYIFYKTSTDEVIDSLENNKKLDSLENAYADFQLQAFNVLFETLEDQQTAINNQFFLENIFQTPEFANFDNTGQFLHIIDTSLDAQMLPDFVKLYFAKVYQKVILRLVEKNETNINSETSTEVYFLIQKNFIRKKKYLELSAFIPIYHTFLKTQQIENLKKSVLSEILGMRSINSNTLGDGLASLIILNNLLLLEGENASVPKIQLNMLVRSFQQWLSSDISYDPEFVPVRIQLLTFFRILIQNNADFKESLSFIVDDLFKDSLSVVSSSLLGDVDSEEEAAPESNSEVVSETSVLVNLNYALLKSVNVLELFFTSNEELRATYWDKESQNDVKTEFVTILVGILVNSHAKPYLLNQGLVLNLDLFKRSILKGFLDVSLFKDSYKQILGSFSKRTAALQHNLKLLEVRRFNVFLIDKLTNYIQKEFIQEFALNYKSIIEDPEGENMIFKIPQELLDTVQTVNTPADYIEFESFNKIFAYLWSWLEILRFFYDNIPSYLFKVYASQLPDNAIENLLNFIFKQIDIGSDSLIDLKHSASREIELNEQNKPKLINMLDDMQNYDYYSLNDSSIYSDTTSLDEIKILLIHLYYLLLFKFRFDTQSWYLDIRNKQMKSNIDTFTTKYISSIIIEKELTNLEKLVGEVKATKGLEDNHSIKMNRIASEVKSQYMIDEQSTEVIIKLPKSYPLTNITVDAPKRIGVKEIVWKSWILACQSLVNSGKTPGSGGNGLASSASTLIYDAIELFDKNINLHFKGFEECAICYAILHLQDKSLPSKSCQTCHNKFHSGCLLKWFKSSGNNTCPMCRSEFNFRLGGRS